MRLLSPLAIRCSRLLSTLALLLTGCTMVVAPPPAALPNSNVEMAHLGNLELLGVIRVPNNTEVFDTRVGGLSALAYDSESNSYFLLSDDRAIVDATRIYQASIDVSDGKLEPDDLVWKAMIPLLDANGAPFGRMALDPEGLAHTPDGFYVSTEGDASANPPIAPAILHFMPNGQWVRELPLPNKFIPYAGSGAGVRDNKGLESLTLTPDGRYLISGIENALAQDGPAATLQTKSFSRLLKIDLTGQEATQEMVYVVETIPIAPQPAHAEADNGLVELTALDNEGTLLAMERSYAVGGGNTVRLYLIHTNAATDVSSMETLMASVLYRPVTKTLLADFGALGQAQGIRPDNVEGLTLGPLLPDGRQLLLAVSDNNFNVVQSTQIWAFALTLPLGEGN